jgi:hypothetical protein
MIHTAAVAGRSARADLHRGPIAASAQLIHHLNQGARTQLRLLPLFHHWLGLFLAL